MQRAYAMSAHHKMTPAYLRTVIVDLYKPQKGFYVEPTWGSERRVALACMLDLRIGFDGASVQSLVDKVGQKKVNHVVLFSI